MITARDKLYLIKRNNAPKVMTLVQASVICGISALRAISILKKSFPAVIWTAGTLLTQEEIAVLKAVGKGSGVIP